MALFPKVEKKVFEDAAVLNEERRLLLIVQGLYVMPSGGFWPCTREELQAAYEMLKDRTYQNWDAYVLLKRDVHIIRPSQSVDNLYFCSCFTGSKNHPCKHSVFVMQFVTKTLVNPFLLSTPIEPRRKRGRPSLAKNALSFD